MTPDLEATLRAALARATPLPWYTLDPPWLPGGAETSILAESPDPHVARFICDFDLWALDDDDRKSENPDADAALIVAAVNALPTLLDTLTALRAQVEALGWYQMDSAPKDGTPFQALIPGYGADNIITWTDGLLDSNGEDCGAWVFASEQEPPDDWTDGYCWEVNEDSVPSTKPVIWRPLPATLESSRG